MNRIKKVHIFLAVIEVIVIIILSLMLYLAQKIYTTSAVFIPKGNISSIIAYLDERNFDINSPLDKYLLIFLGKPQAGWIDMGETEISKGDFLHRLTTAKVATRGIIIYPGETTEYILRMLSKEFDLSYAELRAAYNLQANMEDGLIIPETYSIPLGISARHLISYLINVSNRTYKEMSEKIFRDYDEKKWKRYLIIASIIQKEAGNEEEMPLVSSVIYNRLKKGMRLQMDGALNYGKYSHTAITAKRIDEDDTRFNTYKYSGLPPYPVCVVGPSAIKAAIFPRRSNYLYFVRDKKDKKGGHVFTKNFRAHKGAISKQRRIK